MLCEHQVTVLLQRKLLRQCLPSVLIAWLFFNKLSLSWKNCLQREQAGTASRCLGFRQIDYCHNKTVSRLCDQTALMPT